MSPDLGQADRFLHALGNRFTFQTFGEGVARGNRALSRVLHGTFAEHTEILGDLNARGAGVFVMVNEGDGKGRKADNVHAVRAHFVDLDGAPLQPVRKAPLLPHCIIESSPGRWHGYWWITGAPLMTFKSVQAALAEQFGSDPKVCDLPRVMRLPGFLHRKGEPFRTRIVDLHDVPRYIHADFMQAFGIAASASIQQRGSGWPAFAGDAIVTQFPPAQRRKRRTLPGRIHEGDRNNTLLSLAAGLVRKGYRPQAVNARLQRINAERCLPPLDVGEVSTIAARAIGYGSDGCAILTHKLLDSTEWKALSPPAHDIVVTALRRYDGANNGNITLTWVDFAGLPGFARKGTFYRYRREAVASGILLPRQGGNTQHGKAADLFTIATQWLRSPVSDLKPGASVENEYPYIDKQYAGACAVGVPPGSDLRVNGVGHSCEAER